MMPKRVLQAAVLLAASGLLVACAESAPQKPAYTGPQLKDAPRDADTGVIGLLTLPFTYVATAASSVTGAVTGLFD